MAERKPRGELAELGVSLQNLCTTGKRTEKELANAKREVFKKVVNYMTLGMDMSSLFPIMTSCANLSKEDLVLKKMLYLYITHYASQAPELALLAINQLHKDCHDQDPTVRGLALRTLCSLRVANFQEYVLTPVNVGLEDRHPYVRRTAVMGVLKLHHIDHNIVVQQGMVDKVRHLLHHEGDPQVVANCLAVLMQLEDVEALAKDKVLVYNMVNRLKEFSDWAQCQILELTAHYKPSSEAEVYDIMNALDDRLSHVNAAVVMAAIKVFLLHTLELPATHQQVLERIKDPLKTLLSRDDPANAYSILSHVLVLVKRAAYIFEQDYVSFYCRTHEPGYVKKLKMEILTALASSANVYDIVNELTEYAREVNPKMAREAIKAIGKIAAMIPDVNGIVERLINFLETESDHLVAETLIQMKDLLRRYPDLGAVAIYPMNDIKMSSVEEPSARAALIWCMGQFGENMKDAPYALEDVAENFASEDPTVRLALLTAAAKLFFKRPPEAQKLLGSCLASGIKDSNEDVRDRALFYYRLFRTDVSKAEQIINCAISEVSWFADELSEEDQDRIFRQFNSLAILYQQHSSMFVEDQEHILEPSDQGTPAAGGGANGVLDSTTDTLLGGLDAEADLLGVDEGGPPQPAPSPPPAPLAALTDDFLGLDMLSSAVDSSLDMLGTSSLPQLQLNPQAKISSPAFQEKWRTLPPIQQYTESLSAATVSAFPVNNHKDFTQHMTQAYIMTMASGGQPPLYRYYFYAQSATPPAPYFLVEMIVHTESRQASITFKTEAPAAATQFLEVWKACLAGYFR